MDAAAIRVARHRRIRAQRSPRFVAGFLRSGRAVYCVGYTHELQREGKIQAAVVQKAIKDLEIDSEKRDPVTT